jgi:hypothetical protein
MSLIEMPFDDSIRALESEYYEIVYRFKTIATKNGEERWMGQARVRRKDTGETVKAGCTVFGPDRAFVEQGIIEKLKQTMKDLGIPHGWQTRTRKLLVRYLAFESKITEFRTLVKALSENQNIKEDLDNKYGKFCNFLVTETISFVREIETFTENERAELLLSPEYVYKDPIDPWNLDDQGARWEIYKFFLNPSARERTLHEMHKLEMEKAMANMGDMGSETS